jgi:hypothetical protein
MATMATGNTTGGVAKGSGVNILPDVAPAWQEVRSSEVQRFVVLSYSPPTSKTDVGVLAAGDGGLEQVKEFLSQNKDKVCFGGFKTEAGKFDRFFCIGESVGGLARGRACLHKNAVFNVLEGAVNDITID